MTSTSLMLFAGWFGLAPSANRKATAGLKLEVRDSGLQTSDPSWLHSCKYFGTVWHVELWVTLLGVGLFLALRTLMHCKLS